MAKVAAAKRKVDEPDGTLFVGWPRTRATSSASRRGKRSSRRNPAAGKRLLSAVPKELKESDLAEQLGALCEWLVGHRTDCLRRIETWMLRSLPVPCDVVRGVWPDPDWSDMLRNLVVTPLDAPRARSTSAKLGCLRDVDPKKGIGVVDRDGETRWIAAAQIRIPHPILIDGLDDLREIAVDMGFSQALEQIFRPIFAATPEQKEQEVAHHGLQRRQVRTTQLRQRPVQTARLPGARRLRMHENLGERQTHRGTLLDRLGVSRGGNLHRRTHLCRQRTEAAEDRRRRPGHLQRGDADGDADLRQA